ncbi:ketopantoate hydroxymethyltransferase [Keratinibaculum paraultunense]|uniref:3-methyl-2-oxobutanoate hydroxymethyltransferase n=1 Tax=Keratinibaculum paraultunense TaxID=1278232 RepID=A0A4R3KTP5_9FIRM|nr:3-methyl-2-oxobutanoate hydroxymethyltransferase [Keratinibaculum paraultunense]QQY79160.1 3-methyl-2-oxobutanoate hydroxymethyltransferase [Keratinibaculum paraultunense]TCS88544.1 ketopantoate hydroxymethyltransferase [Keratinibaculum paraultunense]
MKKTVATFKEAKINNEKLSMVTAYDYSMAKIVDEGGIDGILVGDSLGMVTLGYENTLAVTIDDMIHHTKAVSRGANNALVVADMPFLSYHISIEESIRNAGRLIKEGNAHAVKLEGGRDVIDKVEGIVKAQIPVMGHIGLTPQSINMFGGFKVQGKTIEQIQNLIDDAKCLEEAGVFAIVLECIPEKVSKIITESVSIPTIGIGAGKYCDGQILVINDMLGMYSDFTPKFVKQYKNLKEDINEAINNYIKDIKTGAFPEEKHSFNIDEQILDKLNK